MLTLLSQWFWRSKPGSKQGDNSAKGYLQRLVFFSRGVTNASLEQEGNTPLTKDPLTMRVIIGARAPTASFANEVGIGSSSQLLFVIDVTSLVIFSTVTVLKNAIVIEFLALQGYQRLILIFNPGSSIALPHASSFLSTCFLLVLHCTISSANSIHSLNRLTRSKIKINGMSSD